MEAYARLRQDSLVHYRHERRRRSGFFRQSLQVLTRIFNRRQVGNLSQYQVGRAIEYSSASSSETSLLPPAADSEFGDAQSVTTFASSATIDGNATQNRLVKATSATSLLPVHPEKFPLSVGGKNSKPVIPPTLGMTGTEITQIDIHLQNGQRITWRKRKGILEMPESVRKNIWRNAVVNDRKLFICSC